MEPAGRSGHPRPVVQRRQASAIRELAEVVQRGELLRIESQVGGGHILFEVVDRAGARDRQHRFDRVTVQRSGDTGSSVPIMDRVSGGGTVLGLDVTMAA